MYLMANSLDLWTIIRTYSLKNNLPVVDLSIFVNFLSRNAERADTSVVDLSEWLPDTKEKVQEALRELIKEGKCKVVNDSGIQKILIPHFFADKIGQIYQVSDGIGEVPFPDEKAMHVKIPPEYVRNIPVEPSFVNYLNNPQKSELPVIKLTFPKGFGEGFALPSLLPRRLLELSVIKVKESFRKKNRMDFYIQKCITHFSGQEARVREFIGLLMTRPIDCVSQIEEATEFSFGFWLYVCPLIKTLIQDNIARTSEIEPGDVALFQSAVIILILTNYYKIIALNKHNKELSFAEIESKLTELPYYFTMADIMQFKNKNGINLMQKISEQEFSNFILRKMAVNKESGLLPDILTYYGPERIQWLIRKDRVWPLIEMQLEEGAGLVKNEIVLRWTGILKTYRRERAMDKEKNFEDLLNTLARDLCPVLIAILHERKTAVLQEELCSSKSYTAKMVFYFDVDVPLPLRRLFKYSRSEILERCRFSLPFWYSIPFFVSFMCMIKHGPAKKYIDGDKNKNAKNAKDVDSQKAAEKCASTLVPKGTSIDEYILCVLDRWNQLLNKTVRDKLTNDVDAIIRDHVRYLQKMQGRIVLSNEMLGETANRIINMNSALAKIGDRESLVLYIKLSITKMMMWA
ncbi:MAG: hypothetical protein Ta2F_07590 [Termitinemataceae bacterium]|nr:MAG: hypothetical protein Ta2F_07590 [Termitinemataceae bacterium]